MNELVKYRVLDTKGKYHHSYVDLEFAIDCAKHVKGSVVSIDSEEKVYCSKNDKKSTRNS